MYGITLMDALAVGAGLAISAEEGLKLILAKTLTQRIGGYPQSHTSMKVM